MVAQPLSLTFQFTMMNFRFSLYAFLLFFFGCADDQHQNDYYQELTDFYELGGERIFDRRLILNQDSLLAFEYHTYLITDGVLAPIDHVIDTLDPESSCMEYLSIDPSIVEITEISRTPSSLRSRLTFNLNGLDTAAIDGGLICIRHSLPDGCSNSCLKMSLLK